MIDYLPFEQLEIGQAYELDSRNLTIGVWDGRKFHGIRRKFHMKFIDSEIHWDLGGTALPIRKLT